MPPSAASEDSQITLTVVSEARGEASAARQQPAKYCTVRRGDRLSKIARRYHVSLRALAKANGLKVHSLIRPGMRLRIPGPAAKAERGTPDVMVTGGSRLGDSALKYRGVPYRYAGMSSRGMDCSGLVARVLLAHGIRAPHSSRALYRLGKPASRAELKPDDLVFFRTRGRGISHVGIYLGNGEFVHASSGRGRVQTDSLDSGYYARRFVGARRIG